MPSCKGRTESELFTILNSSTSLLSQWLQAPKISHLQNWTGNTSCTVIFCWCIRYELCDSSISHSKMLAHLKTIWIREVCLWMLGLATLNLCLLYTSPLALPPLCLHCKTTFPTTRTIVFKKFSKLVIHLSSIFSLACLAAEKQPQSRSWTILLIRIKKKQTKTKVYFKYSCFGITICVLKYFRRSRRQDVRHGNPLTQCRGFNLKGTVI